MNNVSAIENRIFNISYCHTSVIKKHIIMSTEKLCCGKSKQDNILARSKNGSLFYL